MTTPPVLVRRCLICGWETQEPWGPETYANAEWNLRIHIEHHSFTQLLHFALKQNLGSNA